MRFFSLWAGILGFSIAAQAQVVHTLPGNPGNIFLVGENVSVPLPSGASGKWQAQDYGGRVIARGQARDGYAQLGALPIGFYVVQANGASPITLGVIAPLSAPTPADSPIGIDAAAAWFYKTPEQWKAAANLMRLAGMNWVRDRYHMSEMEPKRGEFAGHIKYDDEVAILHGAGLRILEVSQDGAPWTGAEPHRFPTDLRQVYSFYRGIASRWRGTVSGFETWNEPDFYSTGAEIASFQKAAYLGLKAGNPEVMANSGPWAEPLGNNMRQYRDNDVQPYFDNFDFHHYLPPNKIAPLYDQARLTAAGKPFWVTEFNLPVPWQGDPNVQDPSPGDMVLQAQRVAKLYSIVLSEGAQNALYFIFGNYVEGHTQFGLMHADLTPRPAYIALAATGRLLAGAAPLGRIRGAAVGGSGEDSIYAFSALPDGQSSDVLVAWCEDGKANLNLPRDPIAVYDYMGQQYPPMRPSTDVRLSMNPVFIVLPPGTVREWARTSSGIPEHLDSWKNSSREALSEPILVPPPPPAPAETEAPSPVVLQVVFPSTQLVHGAPIQNISSRPSVAGFEHLDSPGLQNLPIFAYNFSNQPLHVILKVSVPNGWKYTLEQNAFDLPPGERVPVPLTLTPGAGFSGTAGTVKIRAEGAGVGDSVLSFDLAQ